ncbi:MAG: hypothetical protein VX737_04425 [Pseudomonadota bacterium]|nr:hypothetical protein [Pseudomonadota bacterium]
MLLIERKLKMQDEFRQKGVSIENMDAKRLGIGGGVQYSFIISA